MYILLILILIGSLAYITYKQKKRERGMWWESEATRMSKDEAFNLRRKKIRDAIDHILAKIHNKGYDSLSKEQKKYLDDNYDKI